MPLSRASLLLLFGAAGCSLRAPRLTAEACASAAQCGGASCFAGFCHPAATGLQTVVAEVRPPAGSPFGELLGFSLDLRASAVHDLQLALPYSVTGVVLQSASGGGTPTAVAAATVSFREEGSPLPDRIASFQAITDAFGAFSASLPSGQWSVRVEAPRGASTPANVSALPPLTLANVNGAAKLTLVLPTPDSLPRIDGTLVAGGVALSGARVAAVSATLELLSEPAISGADGSFTLFVPAGTQAYALQIGAAMPAAAATPGVSPPPPLPSWPSIAEAGPGPLGIVALDPVPAPTTLAGSVSFGGAPVAGARIAALSTSGRWTLLSSTTSDASGNFSLPTRAGTVSVAAIPATTADAPAISATLQIAVPQTAPVLLECPPKTFSTARVVEDDGIPVPAIQIEATLLGNPLAPGRTANATVTDATGTFQLVADAGNYRLVIPQSADSSQPRWIVQPFPAPAMDSTQIVLPRAVLAGGTVLGVRNGQSAPIANAAVDFFALEGTGRRSVHLGSGTTDAAGRYNVALPDVQASSLVP